MTTPSLTKMTGYKEGSGPVVAMVLDGIGIGSQDERDGVFVAHTPVLDQLMKEPLMVQLQAHGKAVGLPSDGDMGNSEVGHNALGAGRVFSQGAKLVNEALESALVFKGDTWSTIKDKVVAGGTLHLIGLVSDGNVHSHIGQLYRLLDQAAQEGFGRVRVHALLDGRDVEQKSALNYIEPLENRLAELSASGRDYRIASGGGRMVTTMDRYNADWKVVENGWNAHVLGRGRSFLSCSEAVRTFYEEDPEMTDQYMDSFVINDEEGPVGTIEDGDAVIFFNFRGDRAIEISRAFEETDFAEFDRVRVPEVFYAGMMQYDGDALIPKNYLVEPPVIDQTLGEYLCATKITSYAISETQKFGHVTYFWNGNRTGYIDERYEKYEEIASDKIAFDLKPWMKAGEITDQVVKVIEAGDRRFIRLNFANGDMVGHTGVEPAVRLAVETVDLCLRRVLRAIERAGGTAVITADHGNADCMWKEKNGRRVPMVAHTLNPVPFIVKNYNELNQFALTGVEQPGLSNVAASLCVLLGYEPPAGYDPALVKLAS